MNQYVPHFLQNSENYYVVITDLRGNYSYVNRLFEQRYKIIAAEVVGLPFNKYIHPDDFELCNAVAYQCIVNPKSTFSLQIRKPTALENNYHWTAWEFSLINDDNDRPVGIMCVGHDISEFTKMKEDAILYAKKVNNLVEEIQDSFLWIDNTGVFLKINLAAESMFGIKADEIIGVHYQDFFKKIKKLKLLEKVTESLTEKNLIIFTKYWNANKRWYNISLYPSNEGTTIFFRDVTIEKLQADELQTKNTILSSVLNSVDNLNILIDSNYKIVSANSWAIERSFKDSKMVFAVGESILKYLKADDIKPFSENITKALNGEIIKFEKQISYGETPTWYKMSYYPTYDQNKHIFGVTINYVDITARKTSEENLYHSENLLRAFYNSITDATTFIDSSLNILFTNRLSKQICLSVFGREPKVGDKVLDFMMPELYQEFSTYFSRAFDGETVVVEKFNMDHWWMFTLFPVYSDGGVLFGVAQSVKDITESKNYLNKILEQNKTLNEIAWSQSHLVRKPVANITSLVELFESETGEQERRSLLKYLKASAHELDIIINDIIQKSSN